MRSRTPNQDDVALFRDMLLSMGEDAADDYETFAADWGYAHGINGEILADLYAKSVMKEV